MSFDEKNTWVFAVVAVLGASIYGAILLARSQGLALTDVAYVTPMLASIGGAIVANIIGNLVISFLAPEDAGKRDQRDREIERFGTLIGQSFLVIGALAAMVLSMFEAKHFWIANVIYLSFVMSAVFGSMARLAAYRRGFSSW